MRLLGTRRSHAKNQWVRNQWVRPDRRVPAWFQRRRVLGGRSFRSGARPATAGPGENPCEREAKNTPVVPRPGGGKAETPEQTKSQREASAPHDLPCLHSLPARCESAPTCRARTCSCPGPDAMRSSCAEAATGASVSEITASMPNTIRNMSERLVTGGGLVHLAGQHISVSDRQRVAAASIPIPVQKSMRSRTGPPTPSAAVARTPGPRTSGPCLTPAHPWTASSRRRNPSPMSPRKSAERAARCPRSWRTSRSRAGPTRRRQLRGRPSYR